MVVTSAMTVRDQRSKETNRVRHASGAELLDNCIACILPLHKTAIETKNLTNSPEFA
jgi:hypothetical protein